jgi:hypothetical protein
VPDDQVERPEPESITFDDRALESCHHVSRSPNRHERELEPPRRPRLLDPLQPIELLLEPLADVLRLLLLAPLPVSALFPAAHRSHLLLDPRALVGVVPVRVLVPPVRAQPRVRERAPAARILPDAPRLGLELDDLGHALEERTVVGDRDQPASMGVDEALEELEPGEVEVVRRLVEQEHARVDGHELVELRARRLAARAAARLGRLWEVRDLQAGGLAADRPRIRELETREQAEQRCLADAVRSDDADPAVRCDGERDPVEDDRVSVPLADRARCEHTVGSRHLLTSWAEVTRAGMRSAGAHGMELTLQRPG